MSKPVSADQVTKDATVHMAYVAENELTAEEQQQVVHAIPEDYQNEDTFYLVYKRKVLRKLVFLRQEVLTG